MNEGEIKIRKIGGVECTKVQAVDFKLSYAYPLFYRINMQKITKMPVAVVELIAANCSDKQRNGYLLKIDCTLTFIANVALYRKVTTNTNTFRRQLKKLVNDGYLECCNGFEWNNHYSKTHTVFKCIRVDGYRITDKFVEAITNEENLPVKTCSCCKEEKHISEFYPNKSRKGELSYLCKSCDKTRRNLNNAKKRKEK